MKQDTCGHQWIISLTQQQQESDLDAELIQVFNELVGFNGFALYVNKYFSDAGTPKQLNPHRTMEALSPQEAITLLRTLNAGGTQAKNIIPIKHINQVIGFVCISTNVNLLAQTHTLMSNILKVYANQLGLLYKSCLDPLTELLNRQTFDKKVIEIVTDDGFSNDDIESYENQYWFLAIIDIDHFKSVNDTYGHVIGDEVILLVARLLKNNFRLEDYVFRYGGEEFAILFKTQNKECAAGLLNRLRLKISEFSFPQVGQLTVSSGFLQLQAIDSVSSLVNKADVALYHSKNRGRNKVTAYSDLNLIEEVVVESSIELF
ncbi:GGDEF domain-containing protein [Pseudoalteromonas sp. MMG010]|uniref:GGDEF domain-containing protein n=1 Tax=Pseudoalteromonas sp. MMG010 TaxID=2822685 RepID=UPI001B39F617|nr:GGDEF domain-containing protein [Pseudoalteromonas sp. MMG010]MBQ4832006.1 GGDEF domain-containing protein [Pseudoalteromonas sp. MMG010]